MADSKKKKHAVILSGGGANGAYEIGVLKALVAGRSKTTDYKPLEPDIFLGTSVGAYNAAFLASQWDTYGSSCVGNLEEVWLNEIAERPLGKGNGAFRIRGNPLDLLNPAAYLPNPLQPLQHLVNDGLAVSADGARRLAGLVAESGVPALERATRLFNFSTFVTVEPLAELIRRTIRLDRLRVSKKDLVIAATNWALGETEIFTKLDMTDTIGPEIILASTAIPGIFPVQHVGSQPFVDGGVLMNTPLKPAIDRGADVLHVITLNPAVARIGLEGMNNTLATAWRQQVISWVKAVDQNIREIWALNRTLELGELTIKALAGKMDTIDLDMPEGCDHPRMDELPPGRSIRFDVDDGIWEEIRKYRPLTVYLYRPREDLGGPLGLLDFGAERLDRLIEEGFNDAVEFEESDYTYVAPYPIRNKEIARYLDGQRLSRLRGEGPAAGG